MPSSALHPRALAVAAGVVLALLWASMSGEVFRALFDGGPAFGVPYLRGVLASASDVAAMALLAALAAGRGPAGLARLSGLAADPLRPLAFAALVFAPALAACLAFAAPTPGLDLRGVAANAVASPILEEIGYRGLAIGALMQAAGWRFLPAALLPAAFFGAGHMVAGAPPLEAAGVAAVTGAGGLFFGWLFVRWGFNLWPAILAHVGFNALFELFTLGENAVGGQLLNAIRLGVVALAIVLTLMMTPRGR